MITSAIAGIMNSINISIAVADAAGLAMAVDQILVTIYPLADDGTIANPLLEDAEMIAVLGKTGFYQLGVDIADFPVGMYVVLYEVTEDLLVPANVSRSLDNFVVNPTGAGGMSQPRVSLTPGPIVNE